MILLALLALFLINPLSPLLLKESTALAEIFQEKCLETLPPHSQAKKTLASLVCGKQITDPSLQESLSRTSLIHIFVVSGSHLLLLDELLSILRVPLFLRFLFLGFYTLAVGWQPPAVRALITMSLRWALRRQALFFSPDIVTLFSGIFTLIIFPDWWNSLSFQMSWCAGLALSLSAVFRMKKSWQKAVYSQLGIFILMSAPLWGLGSLHPLSILYNLLLAPLVSYILLPLSFLAVAHHWFLVAFIFIMEAFAGLLVILAEPIEITRNPLPSTAFLWAWIFLLHIVLHFLRLHLWQGKDRR